MAEPIALAASAPVAATSSASAPVSAPLAGLQEISLPAAPTWMPQTWGWVVVALLLVMLLAWICWRLYRSHVANRYRGEALRELSQIEAVLTQPHTPASAARRGEALNALPTLVKRVALVFASREHIAALSDVQWLTFLDSTLAGGAFTQGAGRLLPALAYRPRPPSDEELRSLIALLRTWIAKHHAAV